MIGLTIRQMLSLTSGPSNNPLLDFWSACKVINVNSLLRTQIAMLVLLQGEVLEVHTNIPPLLLILTAAPGNGTRNSNNVINSPLLKAF